MILCVTQSKDFYNIDLILNYFEKKGVPAVRFNTDLYPGEMNIELAINKYQKEVAVYTNNYHFNLKDITGVWLRKIWHSNVLTEIDENYRKGVGNEINAVMFEFLSEVFNRVPAVNQFTAEKKVDSNKFYQLTEAVKAGLEIPDTIISSSFKKVTQFYHSVNGKMIAKLQKPLDFSMDMAGDFFPTTAIQPQHLAQMESSLSICPMIFQELIPKAYELRVAYVDGNCFTGKINATQTQNGQTDWRNTETAGAFWETYQLPATIIKKLQQLMNQLQLTVGAIDLIRKPTGEYVFLEVNPSGEWGMLQKFLGYPIAETIGETILKKMNQS